MARRGGGSIHVSTYVEADDIIPELTDDDIRDEYNRRFSSGQPIDWDLLLEIRWNLLRGDVHSALALIDADQEARRIPDSTRQSQYQMANPAAAAKGSSH